MLLCYPDLVIENYNDKEMSTEVLEWYSSAIIEMYETIKKQVIKRNIEDEIEPQTVKFSAEANEEWIRIFNEITITQNSHDEKDISHLRRKIHYSLLKV